jgi:PKD repeat protein
MKESTRYIIFLISFMTLYLHSFVASAQVDKEFWFVVPDLSHRGNTGGTPGTLRFATLQLEATVTISMPANRYNAVTNPTGFPDIVVDIPANSTAAVDLTPWIDIAGVPNTGLENQALTLEGINDVGLHITATNRITAYWEVNYDFGADLWTLKGMNGVGTLFYTPFQTFYDNRNIVPDTYSAIDIVSTQDNNQVTITLPPGIAASYGGFGQNIPPGGTHIVDLDQGQTFSLFPLNFSVAGADRLAGTKIESILPIAVTVKDDAVAVPSKGQDVVGDQIVPVDIIGNNYLVPEVVNPNHIYILAVEDNTMIYAFDADGNLLDTYGPLSEGEQIMHEVDNGNKMDRLTSQLNPGDPIKKFYVWQMGGENQSRGGALVPPIGCTGNTELAFTRARDDNKFYFFLITEAGNEDKFLVDGVREDGMIDPGKFTPIVGSGGWVALFTSSINSNILSVGQHLVENTGGIFHLAILNGFPGAAEGRLYYGYYSDFGGLNIGANVAGTNSSVVRACYGDPVRLYAYGGTNYEWSPQTYLDDPFSNLPTAINLPPGTIDYTVFVSGACGQDSVPLSVIVSSPVVANFEPSVVSGCSPLTITFEDQSIGGYSWEYDMGDTLTEHVFDNNPATAFDPPPDPFEIQHTYVNTSDTAVAYEISLLVKNASGCGDIIKKTIVVFPEITSDFDYNQDESCHPLEVNFTNNSSGNTDRWLWEFGDGGSSPKEEPTHVFNNLFGPNSYQFQTDLIAISPYNCRDTSSHVFTVHPYIEAKFAYDTVAACSPHKIILTDQSIGADSYYWDFGNGSDSTISDPVFTKLYRNLGAEPDTNTIMLAVANTAGCKDTLMRDVIIYPEVNTSFTADPLLACSPADVQFTNTTTGASSYLWDFGDGGSSLGVSPLHFYDRNITDQDTTFTVQLVGTSDEFCRDTATETVTIRPYIEAAFTIKDIVGCSPFEVEIVNKSFGADFYNWSFGDAEPDDNFSGDTLIHEYENLTGAPVNYTLELVVENAQGCSDTLRRIITVNPEITANFSFDRDEGCHPLTVSFTDQSDNAVIYLWDFGDGSASVDPSPEHTYYNFSNKDTTYWVRLTTSTADGECVKFLDWPILVHPNIQAQFTFDDAKGCVPFEVTFENLTIGADEYTWDFGDGTLPFTTNDPADQVHTYTNNSYNTTTDYTVTLVAVSPQNCSDTMIKTVSAYPDIDAGFTVVDSIGCQPFDVQFTNASQGVGTYVWDFGDGSTSNLPGPLHRFTNTGSVDSVYRVKLLTIAPNNTCTDSAFIDIRVHPYIKADFVLPDKLGCTPFDAVIENSSVNGTRFDWDFGDGSIDSTFTTDDVNHTFTNASFLSQANYTITLVASNAAGCTSQRQRVVTVEPDISAGFIRAPVEGCHPLDVAFTENAEGEAFYNWDFGDGSTSLQAAPSHTFTNIGTTDSTYRILLTVTAANNECWDTVSATVRVFPYIDADFTFLDNIQCTPSDVVFSNASVGGTTFTWDFGDTGSDVTNDMSDVTHTFTNTSYSNIATYNVTMIAENDYGCTSQITRDVQVYPDIESEFSTSTDEDCHPLNVQFTEEAEGEIFYSWDFGDGASSKQPSPQHTFTNFTGNPITRQVTLTATSPYNCTHQFTSDIIVQPKPVARFETDRLIACPPFDVPITNTALYGDQYHWDFGDGDDLDVATQDLINHVYDNATAAIAEYDLTLTATTSFGCVDSTTQVIYVYPATIADFSGDLQGCSPHAVRFTNQSERGETYLWDFGDGSTITTPSPSNVYYNEGINDTIYEVSLTSISQYGCTDTMVDTIDVYLQPEADFVADPTLQEYPSASVSFTNLTNTGNWNYQWSMGDGNTSSRRIPAAHTYDTWGDYVISLLVSSPYCRDSTQRSIRIVPTTPVAEFDTVYAECEPLEVQFVNRSLYADDYLWDFADGTTSTEFEPTHIFEEDGVYNVKLTVTGDGGIAFYYRLVEVYPVPVADFEMTPDVVMLPDQVTRFFNFSQQADFYQWDFGDGTISTETNPTHQYEEVGLYDVTLDVWTANGCSDQMILPSAVTVQGEGEVLWPTAFVPDPGGPSGGEYSQYDTEQNRIFHPAWEGVRTYKLEIYTRWGQKLFESNDVNVGWDGYYQGEMCQQGVYIWKATGTYNNGEPFSVAGDVTLLQSNKE